MKIYVKKYFKEYFITQENGIYTGGGLFFIEKKRK